METNQKKTQTIDTAELTVLRQKAARWEQAEAELADLRQQVATLHGELSERKSCAQLAEAEQARVADALKTAQIIIDHSPVILFRRHAGGDRQLVYVSDNIRRFGYAAEAFLNGQKHWKDLIHPQDDERMISEIMAFAEKDVEEYTQIYRVVTADGEIRWVEDQTSVIRNTDGEKIFNQGMVIDITQRKLAEDELRRSEEKFRRIVETAGEGFLLMDEDFIIQGVNDAYCRMIGYDRSELIGLSPFDLATESFKAFLESHRETTLAKEYRTFEGAIRAKEGHEIPILVHGNTLRDDAGAVIGNVAFVTDMTEHKKALQLAGEVQKSLLPQRKPQVSGLDVAGRNISCDEIGGDYFDFLWSREKPGGPFNVVVGDIAGHGVDSALLMTSARAFLRMRASQPGSLAEIVGAMNRHMAQDTSDSGRFMTLFMMGIDLINDRIDWVRAGHDPALAYHPEQDRFEELMGSGMPLGIDSGYGFEQNSTIGVTDGQIIAVGTDGIWEAANTHGEMFGKARLQQVIRRAAKLRADDILDAVYAELDLFTRGRKAEDDKTLVIIKINKG